MLHYLTFKKTTYITLVSLWIQGFVLFMGSIPDYYIKFYIEIFLDLSHLVFHVKRCQILPILLVSQVRPHHKHSVPHVVLQQPFKALPFVLPVSEGDAAQCLKVGFWIVILVLLHIDRQSAQGLRVRGSRPCLRSGIVLQETTGGITESRPVFL